MSALSRMQPARIAQAISRVGAAIWTRSKKSQSPGNAWTRPCAAEPEIGGEGGADVGEAVLDPDDAADPPEPRQVPLGEVEHREPMPKDAAVHVDDDVAARRLDADRLHPALGLVRVQLHAEPARRLDHVVEQRGAVRPGRRHRPADRAPALIGACRGRCALAVAHPVGHAPPPVPSSIPRTACGRRGVVSGSRSRRGTGDRRDLDQRGRGDIRPRAVRREPRLDRRLPRGRPRGRRRDPRPTRAGDDVERGGRGRPPPLPRAGPPPTASRPPTRCAASPRGSTRASPRVPCRSSSRSTRRSTGSSSRTTAGGTSDGTRSGSARWTSRRCTWAATSTRWRPGRRRGARTSVAATP